LHIAQSDVENGAFLSVDRQICVVVEQIGNGKQMAKAGTSTEKLKDYILIFFVIN